MGIHDRPCLFTALLTLVLSRLAVGCIVVSACTGVCSKGPIVYRPPPPGVPEECCLSVQGVYSPFAFPSDQRYADREELGSDDSEDTAVMTPTKYSQAMPTVDENVSQDLPPESYEDFRKAEGTCDGLWTHCTQGRTSIHNLRDQLDDIHLSQVVPRQASCRYASIWCHSTECACHGFCTTSCRHYEQSKVQHVLGVTDAVVYWGTTGPQVEETAFMQGAGA